MKQRILNIGNILGIFYLAAVVLVFFSTTDTERSVLSLFSINSRPDRMALGAAGIIIVAILAILYKRSLKSERPQFLSGKIPARRIYLICAAVMLVTDLLIAIFLKYIPVTDASYMDAICRNYVEGRELYDGLTETHFNYLDRYSNNWGLFLVQSTAYRIVYLILGRIPAITASIVNILFLQLSYFLMYKLAGLVFKKDIQKNLYMLIVLFNPLIYAYSCVFYTDMLSMPFVLGSFYLGISAFESASRKRFITFSCLAALCIGAGYCVKGSVGVIAVALIIYAVFKLSLKRSLAFIAVIVVGFSSVKLAVTQAMYATKTVSKESVEEYGFPTVHWVMMGLVGRGGYDDESFLFSYELPDKQTRQKECTERIGEILNDYGVYGFTEHIVTKLRYTWSGGIYQSTWQIGGSPDGYIQRFFTKSKVYMFICFLFQCFIIIGMTASFVAAALSRRTDPIFIFRLTVFGLGIFLLIWETRSRYMFNMYPVFLMIALDGLEQLPVLIEKITSRFRKKTPAENKAVAQ